MTNIIQVDYEGLSQVASVLRNQSDVVAELQQRIDRAAQQLLSEGWQGCGSTAFAADYAPVSAALQRLTTILSDAAGFCATDIPQTYRRAEEEAAAPFQGRYDGTAAAAAVDTVAAEAAGGAAVGAAGAVKDIGNGIRRVKSTIPPELYLNQNSTVADVARLLLDRYNSAPGTLEEAVTLVDIGDNRYMLLVIGTDTDYPFSLSTLGENLHTGLGQASAYTDAIKACLEDANLPPGATIYMTGHSQGGHGVNVLSHDQDLLSKYKIEHVETFGSSSNTEYNKQVGRENYSNYIVSDDQVIGGFEFAARSAQGLRSILPLLSPAIGLHDAIFGIPDYIQNEKLSAAGGHGGYANSRELAERPVAVKIDRFVPISGYQIADTGKNTLAKESAPLLLKGRKGFEEDPIKYTVGGLMWGTYHWANAQ